MIGDARLIGPITNGTRILLSTRARFAGAVNDIRFKGMPCVNDDDHGRLCQIAIAYDDLGERDNPTEAGSLRDGEKLTTTSKLLHFSTTPSTIHSVVRAAYWKPVNGKALSDTILEKTLTVGIPGFPNVIRLDSIIHIPVNRRRVVIESPAFYMPPNFRMFQLFDPVANTITTIPPPTNGRNGPLIPLLSIGLADCVGAWGVPDPRAEANLYGCIAFPSRTSKWNRIIVLDPAPAGPHSFRTYIAFGSRALVRSTLRRLIAIGH